MKRIILVLAIFLSTFGWADETYLGVYLQGSKVGYVHSTSVPEKLNGKAVTRSDSRFILSAALLGQSMSLEMRSTTWTDAKGAPLRMRTSMTSSGRGQTVDATFKGSQITLTIDNSGQISKKSLEVPSDGKIVDDAVMAMLSDKLAPGSKKVYYALDPMTATLVRNTVTLIGKSKAIVRGLPFNATLIEVAEPRAVTKVFVSAKGDLIKAEAPMGMELLPISKAEALKPESGSGIKDLAVLSRVSVDKPFGDPSTLRSATLRFSGANLSALPSDSHQTVSKEGNTWIVETRSAPEDSGSKTIAEAAALKPEWTKPSLNIPSNNKAFLELAQGIIGTETDVTAAARMIRTYVTSQMRPNASIGVLRDASEVLKTKEGVCRDYAVLTATILRAAGIPARMASGLVYQGGAFYYHAWAQAFNGKDWVGVDSTRPDGIVGVGHIELALGSVEEAFSFTFLDQVRVEVLKTVGKH